MKPVLKAGDILDIQRLVRVVPVSDLVIGFAVDLARKTRPGADAPDYIKDWISWGAGPRASQYLILGAKTRCILNGRSTPDMDDIRRVAVPVLRHRMITNFNAEADGISTPMIIQKLLDETVTH
jgi:MoxR-like ATPase